MAQRTRTFPIFLDSRITSLTCHNTTIGSSTVHSFAAVDIPIPETTGSRTIRSVEFHLFAMMLSTATSSIDQTRYKLNWNGGSGSNVDQTNAVGGALTCATPQQRHFVYDVTADFVANFGAGDDSSLQVDVAFVTSAGNVINVSGKFVITVEVDDTSDTYGDFLCIPLDSQVANLTGSLTEIGTNQIPDVLALLAEYEDVDVKQIAIEIEGNYNQAASFTMSLAFDAEGATARAPIVTESWSATYKDVWVRDDLDLSVVHAFKASTTANGFVAMSIRLWVLYNYTPPAAVTGTSFVSREIPFVLHSNMLHGSAAGNEHIVEIPFFVHEATPVMAQSGIELTHAAYHSPGIGVTVGSQSDPRNYAPATSTQVGMHSLSHRIDSGAQYGSGHTLVRGWNALRVTIESTAALGGSSGITGVLILNYSCDTPAAGDAAKTRSMRFIRKPWRLADTQGTYVLATASGQTPVLPSEYMLASDPGFQVGYEMSTLGGGQNCNPITPTLETFADERQDAGWQELETVAVIDGTGVWGGSFVGHCFTTNAYAMRWPGDPDATRLDVEVARRLRLTLPSAALRRVWVSQMVEIHTQTFTVSGQVLYAPDPAGITLSVRNDDGELVATCVTDGDGNYSATVYAPGDYLVDGVDDDGNRGRSGLVTAT